MPSPTNLDIDTPTAAAPVHETSIPISDVTLVTLEDLDHLREGLLRGALTSTWSGVPLIFTQPTSGDYARYDPESTTSHNEGPYALDPDRPVNRRFLDYYQWLLSSLTYLNFVAKAGTEAEGSIRDYVERLVSRVRDELSRLEDIKEIEWYAVQISSDDMTGGDPLPYKVVDTGASAPLASLW